MEESPLDAGEPTPTPSDDASAVTSAVTFPAHVFDEELQEGCEDARADALGRAPSIHGYAQRLAELRLRHRLLGEVAEPIRVDRFALERELGSGGMGTVWLARDEQLARSVALKFVARDLDVDDRWMFREAQGLARLSHPNVVPIFDVGFDEGRVWLAMEYIPGRTLRSWRRERRPGRAALLSAWIAAGHGLAAVHRAGLIHRDVKPDNILIGEDGRVRLVDFGLVRAVDRAGHPAGDGDEGEHDLLTAELSRVMTVAGDDDDPRTRASLPALIGTPAYIAPELLRGEQPDARADQYSFCVSLYEELCGQLPFAGQSLAARRRAALRGELRSPPADVELPRWLFSTLARGLAGRPEDRFPSMEALLEALANDPVARRRRRLRQLAVFAVIAAVFTALALIGVRVQERRSEARRQARAYERLAALDARLDALGRDGELQLTRQLLRVFVDEPEQRDTEAVALGWLHQAARERGAGESEAVVDALAAAYSSALAKSHGDAALRELALHAHRGRRWEQLARVLALAEQRREGAELYTDESQLSVARFDSHLDRRDVAAAIAMGAEPLRRSERAALAPLLDQLSHATDTGRSDSRAVLFGSGDSRLVFGSRDGVELVRRDTSLTRVAMYPQPRARRGYLADAGAGFVVGTVGDSVRLLELGDTGPKELLRWPDAVPLAATTADLDGDGVRELYVGTGPYTRHLVELRQGPDGAWQTRTPAPVVDSRLSDITGLLAGDLDGDGREELVVALGPWRAYELMILRHSPASEQLELVSRHRVGNVASATLARRRGRPPAIAAHVVPWELDAGGLPFDQDVTERAGVHVFSWVDGRLERRALSPARYELDERVGVTRLFAGDLDGDGDDELIYGYQRRVVGEPPVRHTVILSGAAPQSPPLVLGGAWPRGVAALDGDGDDELVLALERPRGVWVVGAGASSLPRASLAGASTLEAADQQDIPAALARRWRRAHELRAIGTDEQAADAFIEVAALADDDDVRARALREAAAIHEERRDDEQAARIYRRASEHGADRIAAVQAATRSALRRGDFAGARDLLDAALARDGVTGGARAELVRARDEASRRADGELAHEILFDAPLPSTWSIEQPLALRRDGAGEQLRVESVIPGGRALTWTPARGAGGAMSVEAELDVERVEWGASLQLGLFSGASADVTPQPLAVIRVKGGGGSSARTLRLQCEFPDRRSLGSVRPYDPARSRDERRVRVRAVLDAATGEVSCAVVVNGQELVYARELISGELPEARGDLQLRVQSGERIGDGASHRLSAAIRRVAVAGVYLGDGPREADATRRVAAALVEGDVLTALAELDRLAEPTPTQRLWRVVALLELARWEEARDRLREIIEAVGLEPLRASLVALMHIDPQRIGPLVRAAAGPRARTRLLVDAWSPATAHAPVAAEALRVLREGLVDIERIGESPEQLVRDLYLRARMHEAVGADEQAWADRERALAILGGPAFERAGDEEWRTRIRRELIFTLAHAAVIEGDDARAAELLAQCVRDDPYARLWLEDSVRAHPEFSRLLASGRLEL